MISTLAELSEADVLELSARSGEPVWLRDRRLEAYKVFLDLEWPHNRVEEWRYTDPKRFDLTRVVLDPDEVDAQTQPAPRSEGIVAAVRERAAGSIRLVDGAVPEVVLRRDTAEAGVVLCSLATGAREHDGLVRDALGKAVGAEGKYNALSLAAFTGGVFVYVPPDVELADPITVEVQVTRDGAVAPRVLVLLGAHARASVYVDHSGDAAATVIEVVESVLGEGSRLDLVTAQDWGDAIDEITAHTGYVGPNADYHHLEVTLGGRTVYVTPDVHLSEPGGTAELLGVYFTHAGQQVEHRSLIHHDASKTTSNTVYKGALQGDSRATWYGNIRIEPHARATSSDETNRNLILTDLARADSIPFLEIENSDVVRCGHHSSVGQVDELQLFYLESRGIPREEAARLLVFGFFREVTDRINVPEVTETVLAQIERQVRSGPTTLMDQRRR